MSALMEVRGVTRVYGRGDATVYALAGIDLDLHEGQFVSLMGPSGSGKSTMLNVLGCLDLPTEGTYRFDGQELTTLDKAGRAQVRRDQMGFVFQGFNLLARSTAVENVELPLIYRRTPRHLRRERALRALEQVGLADRASHLPSELSGGQQQRVAIARALVTEARVLLADEPTGNLDTTTSHEVMSLLAGLNESTGMTILMVTHEPEMAEYTPRVIHFLDGRIDREENRDARRTS